VAYLEVEALDVFYGSVPALYGISLQVEQGTCRGVVGRNGAGKSTLLRSILGAGVRRRGQVSIDGASTIGRGSDQVTRLGVSWVPEDRRIFPGLTVAENIQLGARCFPRNQRRTLAEIEEMFPLLRPLMQRDGGRLSGGEQQLVAIARALVASPNLLLLDEPTEGLAPVIVEQLLEQLGPLCRDAGLTVVLAEQNLEFVAELATDICVLANGSVVFDAKVEEFRNATDIQRRFLSVASSEPA
jgi:branched-chain amino acid transport system ATP-binding protein